MNDILFAPPAEMSTNARVAEITAILAAAVIRNTVAKRPRQSEVGLGFLPGQSVHTTPF